MTNQEYSSQPSSDGITFRDIWHFVKKSIPMLIVCLIVCCLIVGAVGIVIIAVKGNTESANGAITFNYDGIFDGKNPDKTQFDAQSLRSPYCVATALSNLGLSSDYDALDVRSAITIDSVVPKSYTDALNKLKESGNLTAEQISALSFTPNTFTVSLDTSVFDDKGMNKMDGDTAKKIVNELMSVYIASFVSNFSADNSPAFSIVTEDDVRQNDFAIPVLSLYAYIDNVESYIETLENMTATSTVTDKNGAVTIKSELSCIATSSEITSLKSKVATFKNKFSSVVSTLIKNDVWRDKKMTEALLTQNLGTVTAQIAQKTASLTAIKDFLASYKEQYPNVTVGSSSEQASIDFAPSDAFDSMFSYQLTLQKSIEKLNVEKDRYTSWLAQIDTGTTATAEQIASAENSLVTIAKDAASISQEFATTLDKYESVNTSNMISVSSSAVVATTSTDLPWLKMFVIAIVAGILLGFVLTPVAGKIKANKQAKLATKSNALSQINDVNDLGEVDTTLEEEKEQNDGKNAKK